MKRFLSKFGLLLLALVMMVTCLSAVAGAYAITIEKPALLRTETLLIPGAMDQNQQMRVLEIKTEPTENVAYGQETYLTDVNEAAALLREAMENREEAVTILFEASADLSFQAVADSICDAISHEETAEIPEVESEVVPEPILSSAARDSFGNIAAAVSAVVTINNEASVVEATYAKNGDRPLNVGGQSVQA
jgi:hypothetical protein